jgi:hypothetical protein
LLSTPTGSRVALFNHDHDVAIYRDGHLVVFGLKKAVHHFHCDPATDLYESAPPDPDLGRLGIAYFQTAYELFATHRYEPADASDATQVAARRGKGS